MWQRFASILLVLVVPSWCWAQEGPEAFLPAKSQVFFHWQGFKGHEEAYAKTAIAKMMDGDMGPFLKGMVKYMGDQMENVLRQEMNPEIVRSVRDELNGFFNTVTHNGFAMGMVVRKIDPIDMDAVIVFPNGAGKSKSPLSLMNLSAQLDKTGQVKKLERRGKTVHYVGIESVYMAWWGEGDHAVVTFSTKTPADMLARMSEEKGKLAEHPLYKQVKEFDEFPIWCRGYVDVPGIGKVVREFNVDAGQIMDEMGLQSVKSLTFFSGFDGPAERSVTQMDLEGPRKGIFKLASNKTFTMKDLPPMAEGITAFSASNVELGTVYEVTLDTVEAILKIAAPNEAQAVNRAIADFELNTGVSLSKDVFGSLGSKMVAYSAWPEGPLGLGQVTLIEVKNAKKLEDSLIQMARFGQNQALGLITLSEVPYRGARMYTLGGPGTGANVITWTIHKGWLAVSTYPQPVKGYILRANGDLPSWKASPELEKILANFPKDFTVITVHDPRPSLKVLLSVTPVAMSYTNLLIAEMGKFGGPPVPIEPFDIHLIPNAYEATQHLFPNVTITTDNGRVLRVETRSSLGFPF